MVQSSNTSLRVLPVARLHLRAYVEDARNVGRHIRTLALGIGKRDKSWRDPILATIEGSGLINKDEKEKGEKGTH